MNYRPDIGGLPPGLPSPQYALRFEMLLQNVEKQFEIVHEMTIVIELTKAIRLQLNFNERLSTCYGHLYTYTKATYTCLCPMVFFVCSTLSIINII